MIDAEEYNKMFAGPRISWDAVRFATELLRKAEAGEICSLAYVATDGNGNHFIGFDVKSRDGDDMIVGSEKLLEKMKNARG